MCGIVGTFVYAGSDYRVSESLLVNMRDTMLHRGPDGAGIWLSDNATIGLAHRRLAILDLSSAADQPMRNASGTLRVVFNGEIYNHRELRKELQGLGYGPWSTDHSDTEVILFAFEAWGIECIERFVGMFAIGLWDARNEELWLIRDRLGVKPLYYSEYGGRISFASEIKALLADPDRKRTVNEEALFHYLSFLTTPAPDTLFDGINKVPNGTWLRITRKGIQFKHRYWDPLERRVDLNGLGVEDIAAGLFERIDDAVRYRMVSDVPVGVFLSGGIDSSTNAALFSREPNAKVRTFSIGYASECESYRDEVPFARKVADKIGAEHYVHYLTLSDLEAFLPEMIKLQDEPIGDPVCVPVYYVSKLARERGVIVCQVGEGADELFCGYPGWLRQLRVAAWNEFPVPNLVKQLGMTGLGLLGGKHGTRFEYLRRGVRGEPIFWGGAEAFTHEAKLGLMHPEYQRRFRGYTSYEALAPIRARFESLADTRDHLKWMTYLDLNLRLPELLLMRVDKMSMGVSLEARVPFLDAGVVEYAMGIPSEMQACGGELKHVLKRAVRGLIPDDVIDRPKQGFGIPMGDWFSGDLVQKARCEISEFCESTPYFDTHQVNKLVRDTNSPQPWYLLNLAMWWKTYVA